MASQDELKDVIGKGTSANRKEEKKHQSISITRITA
ncbi:hypothetical protein CCACVL1_03385 [Corchorus capsularis]|uniref:Uncharacterized protein n=1 Tax=Corchorus capsularis TaxID=210143 RepID=A0A1R3JZR5_COCAP|nr:hypothetical protein CCACVL1_03385 [Corchorus capsularis]